MGIPSTSGDEARNAASAMFYERTPAAYALLGSKYHMMKDDLLLYKITFRTRGCTTNAMLNSLIDCKARACEVIGVRTK